MHVHAKAVGKATLTLIGTIIGAGVFGLPLVFTRVGFWPGTALFALVMCLVWATHILYAEIILSTSAKLHYAGYAKRMLGRFGQLAVLLTYPLHLIGACLVYLIFGGQFLSSLTNSVFGVQVEPLLWSALFGAVSALIVLVGLALMAKIESVATWLLIVGMLFSAMIVLYTQSPVLVPISHWKLILFPFGIFLFTLSGFPVIGEVVAIIGSRSRAAVWTAVTIGTVAASILAWLFGITVAFTFSGKAIPNIIDWTTVLPSTFGWLIPLVGFFAIATSMITISQELKTTLRADTGYSRTTAWSIASIIPLALMLLINGNLLSLIGWMGALLGGLNGIIIALIGYRLFSHISDKRWLSYLSLCVGLAYSAGIIHHILYNVL